MHTTIDTPAGPLTLLAGGDTVLAAGFTDDVGEVLVGVPPDEVDADADLDRIAKAVRAYLAGSLTAIDEIPVRQPARGAFLSHAQEVLRGVPAGNPVTYSQFAALSGRPAAVRAAAQACARNTIALFVPCHRVVRLDGGLGGYRWGIEVKRWLLAHERTNY